jgi:hypothetical protein
MSTKNATISTVVDAAATAGHPVLGTTGNTAVATKLITATIAARIVSASTVTPANRSAVRPTFGAVIATTTVEVASPLAAAAAEATSTAT